MKPNCYNRAPYKSTAMAQDGWTEDGRRIVVEVPDNMSKGCQQWGAKGEARIHGWDCDGCRWREYRVEVEHGAKGSAEGGTGATQKATRP